MPEVKKQIEPSELAMKRRCMALEYKQKITEQAEIRERKAEEILMLLAEHKTVSKAELFYNATKDGKRDIYLTLYLKGLLETMRALKTEIDVLNSERFI